MTDTDLDALEKRFSTMAYEPLSREATLVLVRALADLRDRIATIASEAFGPFPVQTVEEDLTAIERGIYEEGKYGEEWRARAEKAERDLAEWQTAGQQIVDMFDPMKAKADPQLAAIVAKAAREAHLVVRAERGAARAALTEACDIATLYAGDGDDPDALAVCKAHATRIATLRPIAAGTPLRPPIDPVLVEALRGMLAVQRDHLKTLESIAISGDVGFSIERTKGCIAALTAVLGETP